MFIIVFDLLPAHMIRDGVIPACEHGMAAANTRDAEQKSLEHAVLHNSLLGIKGTAWGIDAPSRNQGRYDFPVDDDRYGEHKSEGCQYSIGITHV